MLQVEIVLATAVAGLVETARAIVKKRDLVEISAVERNAKNEYGRN
jgi:hypothetical protein